jgi:hypothetical protein
MEAVTKVRYRDAGTISTIRRSATTWMCHFTPM